MQSALHQLHAPIFRTTGFVIVAGDWRRHAHADGRQSIACDAVLLRERLDDRLRAPLRQTAVVIESADVAVFSLLRLAT